MTEPPITHGRHCPCSPCAREDWTRPDLAPCGMHGPDCPAVYAPLPAPLPEPTISLRMMQAWAHFYLPDPARANVLALAEAVEVSLRYQTLDATEDELAAALARFSDFGTEAGT